MESRKKAHAWQRRPTAAPLQCKLKPVRGIAKVGTAGLPAATCATFVDGLCVLLRLAGGGLPSTDGAGVARHGKRTRPQFAARQLVAPCSLARADAHCVTTKVWALARVPTKPHRHRNKPLIGQCEYLEQEPLSVGYNAGPSCLEGMRPEALGRCPDSL